MCIGEIYDLVCVVWKALTWYVKCGLLYVQTLTDCKLGCVKNNGILTITAIVHSITIVQTFLNYSEIGIIYLCILYSQIKQLVILFDLCYYISRKKKYISPSSKMKTWLKNIFYNFLDHQTSHINSLVYILKDLKKEVI